MLPSPGSAAGVAAVGAGLGALLPSRKPHDPQKRFDVVFTWLHWGQTTAPLAAAGAGGAAALGAATVAEVAAVDPSAAAGGAARGGATGATGDAATATVPARPAAACAGDVAARTPCGGVRGEKGFGAASRGNSAPHPRQNL
jgi:hypothetical protein